MAYASSASGGILRDKRLWLVALFAIALSLNFWMTSRYPQLNEKAAMSGVITLENVLVHDEKWPTPTHAGYWERVAYATANWTMANKNGMIYGLLIAAAFMVAIRYLLQHVSAGKAPGYRGIFEGLLIGAPLGVCVNCVAPISKGIFLSSRRAETALAVMFSSPTLNIVVLSMTFILLPAYLAWLKLALVLALVLGCLPVLLRFFPDHKLTGDGTVISSLPALTAHTKDALPKALLGAVADYIRHLWFIVLRTVPLMLLAGFLGSVLAQAVDLHQLAQGGDSFLALVAIAFIGTFFPMPMAVDVMSAHALLLSGMPVFYAMPLLFTLGSYSAFAFFIVGRTFSWRLACALYITIVSLGVLSGYIARGLETSSYRQLLTHIEALLQSPASSSGENALQAEGWVAAAPPIQPPAISTSGDVTLRVTPLRARNTAATPFTVRQGPDIGLNYVRKIAVRTYIPPFYDGAGLAAEDIDGDGWTDIAVAGEQGVLLYQNLGGTGFRLAHTLPARDAFNISLPDLNNDGKPDVHVTTFGGKNVLHYQKDRPWEWQEAAVPASSSLLSYAVTYADLNRDGFLDIYYGNWSGGVFRRQTHGAAPDILAFGPAFQELQFMKEATGEATAALFSDLTMDGRPDLMVANDFDSPDVYYLNHNGHLKNVRAADGFIPYSGYNSMGFDTADIDNDGDLDMYLSALGLLDADILNNSNKRFSVMQEQCEAVTDAERRQHCLRMIHLDMVFSPFPDRYECDFAKPYLTESEYTDCNAVKLAYIASKKNEPALCEKIPAGYDEVSLLCNFLSKTPGHPLTEEDRAQTVEAKFNQNFLFLSENGKKLTDATNRYGVAKGNWSWSAKFADIDNDEWQDLYLVNGSSFMNFYAPNLFFHNEKGEKFVQKEKEYGLADTDHASAFVYFDMDNDGDLDILRNAANGPLVLYVNNSKAESHGITLRLKDAHGNRLCVGCKVTVTYGGSKKQIREIKAGSGFLSFDPAMLHFGLGEHTEVSDIRIDWNDGNHSILKGPFQADHHYVMERD